MFENESDFKKLVDRVDIDSEPSVAHRENLRREMLSAFRETSQPDTVERPPAAKWQTIIHAILKSKIAKLAAAAVVIIAVAVVLQHYSGSIGLTTPAFSQVIENMQRMKWIYFFKEDLQDGTIREQVWACPESQILMGIGTKGWVGLVDCKAKRKYTYSPQQGAIEVSYLEDDFGGMYRMYVSAPLGLVDEIIQIHRKEDAYISRQEATYNGRDAIVYRFEVGLSADVAEISNWVVDAKTHLPIINEVVRVTAEGKVMRSHRFAFDYPETGPREIYDLGVPRDANIIDKTPSEAVEEILRTYQEFSKTVLQRYIAVIKQWDEPRYIEYGGGQRFRQERYELAIDEHEWKRSRDFYLQEMGDTFDSLYKWVRSTNTLRCKSIWLYDGVFNYTIDRWDIEHGKSPGRDRAGWWPEGRLVSVGWPAIPFEGKISRDDYSRENGLICIERTGSKYYIDPNRDYICQRRVRVADGKIRREVVEYGQTKSGHWYPKVVKEPSGTKTVYLKENPDFPENIFSPRSLPNYAEWESNDVEAGFVIRKPSPDSNEVPEYEGFTPLHMAVFTGNTEAAKSLLAAGTDANPKFAAGATPMELAAAAGRLDMVKLLFEHGADFTSPDGEQRCALGAAVVGGNLDVLKFMLDNGADVNGSYKEGKTALHYAAEKAKTECVRVLLDYRADVEKRDEHGKTPLLAGVERGRFIKGSRREECGETARLLLEAGADVDTAGQDGRTPLSLLCLEVNLSSHVPPNIELIKLLVEKGADVNFHLPGEGTSLINAVIAKDLEVVKILLEAGADPFVEAHPLWPSPIAADIAAAHRSKEIEQLLRKHMEPRVSTDNEAIKGAVRRLLNAVRDGSVDAVKEIDVDCPLHEGMWDSRLKTLHDDYAGEYELSDNILSMRAQSGWAEVIIKRPKLDKKRYLSIILMQYPDDSWKVVSWYTHSRSLDPKRLLQHPPASGSRRKIDDYRDALFKAAGKTEN